MRYSVKSNTFGIRPKSKKRPEQQVKEDYEFYEGDQWNLSFFAEKAAYVDDHILREIIEITKTTFQFNNIIRQCVDRHIHGLFQKRFTYFFADEEGESLSETPTTLDKELKQFIEEYENISLSLMAENQSAIEKAVTDAKICGVGYIRLFNPQYLNLDLTMHSPDYDEIYVARDTNQFPRWLCYYYTDETDNQTLTELQHLNEVTGLTDFYIVEGEVSPSNRVGSTTFKFLPFAEILTMIEGRVRESWSLDLDGHFSVVEFRLKKLLTDDVKSLQKGFNHELTLMSQYIATFQQTQILNGLPPGEYKLDEDTQELTYEFTPEIELRVNTREYIQGLCERNEDGLITGYTTPQVVAPLPASISHFVESLTIKEVLLYRAMNQGHIPTENNLQLSGRSRTAMRADHRASLEKDSMILQPRLATLFKTILLLKNIGNPTKISKIKEANLVIQLNIEIGEPSPEEKAEVRNNYQAGLLSLSSAISAIGKDPLEEKPLIEEDQESLIQFDPNPLGISPVPQQQNPGVKNEQNPNK
ncbi:MAG: hypothetical protein F6J98_01685 [Moorea sp. SIO4G2]|nr:hypothetical protein [Moorena sp. SIO4G2]